ncbi:F-box/LRR-repeat protein 15-like [Branchiostoma lanceolatum]|uniref:F-box/LRR-repeat protein 15-like n=1 Tax=Branchiostoma lanceolatum TaxID=7740 RepID=UPI0034532CAE
MATGEDLEKLTMLDVLPWEDVLNKHVLPCLSIQDLFQLRQANTQALHLVTTFFNSTFKIDLSPYSSKITADAFKLILGENQVLNVLVLSGCKNWLTDRLLVPVIMRNERLLRLNISNCLHLQSETIQAVAENCHSLTALSLKDCHWLNVPSFLMVAVSCRELEKVDLTSCWEVDDECIMSLVVACKKLTHLSLAKIYGITNQAIDAVAKGCPRLQYLDVQGCWRVNNSAIRNIGEYCKRLQVIKVSDCRDVTEASLARLRLRGVKVDVPAPVGLNLSRVEHTFGRSELVPPLYLQI